MTDVNWEFLEKMFEQAARRAPALAGAGIKTAWAGLYESTPDHQAILGPDRRGRGVLVRRRASAGTGSCRRRRRRCC